MTAAALSSKSTNPFQANGWNYFDQLGESASSYLPNYYENDIINNKPMTPTFRLVSPKIYHQEQHYFAEINEELKFGDDCDALYEATLMNSNFLGGLEQEKKSANSIKPIDRLGQILGHINPNYYSKPYSFPLSDALASINTSPPPCSTCSQKTQPPNMVA